MPIDNEQDDGLTPEERAALGEDDGAGTPPADVEDDAANADEAAAAAAEAEKAKQEAEAAKATDDAAAAATETPPADAAATETEAAQQSAPILVAQPTADAQAKLTDIETKKEALLTQFDDGDITARDYQKQLDALAKEERKIEFEIHEANLAAKLETQRLQNDWNKTCDAFVDSHPVYKDMPWAYKELDAAVRDLASKPETAQWSGQKFLDEAHKAMVAKYKFPEPAAADKQQRQRQDLPPNLAKVPAANLEDTTGGRFAVLDRMAQKDRKSVV